MMESLDKSVPLGVLLVVVFWMFLGSFFVADGAAGFSGGINVAIFLLIGILFVLVGFGLLQMQNWARLASMVLAGLGLPPSMFLFVFNMNYFFLSPSMLVILVTPGVLLVSIWYLHHVRSSFSKGVPVQDTVLR
jgi:hypothetical protein